MLPWGQLLRAAQSGFGLLPAQFWALSVLEWRSLQNPHNGHADRSALQELIATYPDISTQVRENERPRHTTK